MPNSIQLKVTWLSPSFARIDFLDAHGRQLPVFGVWKHRERNGLTYYENDTNSGIYRSMDEVKAAARATVRERGWDKKYGNLA